MANLVTIDLSTPEMRAALAECDPGETHSITMDITVEEKNGALVGLVDPSTVEKYGVEYEEEGDEEVAAQGGDTPKAVTILLSKGEA
jgi:hypothetical protein